MNLIGSIKRIDSKLGKRSPDQSKSKSSPQSKHHDTVQEKIRQPDHDQLTAFDEIQPGRNIDTIA